MKFYLFFIFLSLIIFIKNTQFCEVSVPATKPDDCKDLVKGSRANYCCFFKGKWKGTNYNGGCIDITPIRYSETEAYIEEMNKDADFNIEKIDCKSFFLKLSIVYLVVLLM